MYTFQSLFHTVPYPKGSANLRLQNSASDCRPVIDMNVRRARMKLIWLDFLSQAMSTYLQHRPCAIMRSGQCFSHPLAWIEKRLF